MKHGYFSGCGMDVRIGNGVLLLQSPSSAAGASRGSERAGQARWQDLGWSLDITSFQPWQHVLPVTFTAFPCGNFKAHSVVFP